MAMIMADNNFLIGLLGAPEQYQFYVQALKQQQAKIGIPTPVLAEFIVRDDNAERTNFLTASGSFLQIFDFDRKSAILSAKIMRKLLEYGYFANKGKDKQIIKVDIQILGIVLANGIRQLYSTDKEIVKIVDLLELPIEMVDFRKNSGLPQADLFCR